MFLLIQNLMKSKCFEVLSVKTFHHTNPILDLNFHMRKQITLNLTITLFFQCMLNIN